MSKPHTSWRPRASQIGGYFACSQRAAFDRTVAEGDMPKPEGCGESSVYADLGTWIHAEWQRQLDAKFLTPPGADELAKLERAAARVTAEMFDSDMGKANAHVAKVARLAVQHTPVLPPGVVWFAEVDCKSPYMTGHIDLLASDGSWLIDLKTTSRVPDHQRPKAAHLYQMVSYYDLLPFAIGGLKPKKCRLLYVDSGKAAWAMPSDFDFEAEQIRELADMTVKYAKRLRTKAALASAVPNLGPHCAGGFCPYVAVCRDRFVPGAADVHRLAEKRAVHAAGDLSL